MSDPGRHGDESPDKSAEKPMTRRGLTISRRFVIVVAAIYSLLIAATAVSVNMSVRRNGDILKKTLDVFTSDTLIARAMTVMDSVALTGADSPNTISSALNDACSEEKGFLHAIVYGKTADEEYFRVLGTVDIGGFSPGGVDRNETVKELKDINYLKEGLFRGVADPLVYSSGGNLWKNVYVPYRNKNRTWVIQFMMTSPAAVQAMEEFNDSTAAVRTVTVAVSAVLVVAVILLTVIFLNNYGLLISSLSRYMREAAGGNLQVSLNPAADAELEQLALSFNSMIEEMKEMKDVNEKTATESIHAGALFKEGVSLLREGRYDDAIALFRTLVMKGHYVFGSTFNLGVAYAKQRRYPLSLEMFSAARELNPEHRLTVQYMEKVERLRNFNG